MNKRIEALIEICTEKEAYYPAGNNGHPEYNVVFNKEKFAKLIAKDCIHYIETHRIPVGNSAAGEMACEWTYDALKSIRDEIKEHFGIKD